MEGAIAKKERMKQYSFSHRERSDKLLLELISQKENIKSSRLDHCVELQAKPFSNSNSEVDSGRLAQLKLRGACKQERMEDVNSPFSRPRRCFCHAKQRSMGDDGSLPSSPVFPTYMAATESAKAKSRSLSTPRQRFRLFDTYSGEHSPYKLRLISWSSVNGEIAKSNKRNSISEQKLN